MPINPPVERIYFVLNERVPAELEALESPKENVTVVALVPVVDEEHWKVEAGEDQWARSRGSSREEEAKDSLGAAAQRAVIREATAAAPKEEGSKSLRHLNMPGFFGRSLPGSNPRGKRLQPTKWCPWRWSDLFNGRRNCWPSSGQQLLRLLYLQGKKGAHLRRKSDCL